MTLSPILDVAVTRLSSVRLSAAALALGTSVFVVLVLGCISRFVLPYGSFSYALLNMDGERSIPAVFSGALLLLGGLLAFFGAPRGVAYRLLGLGLIYAALDEVFALHELLQRTTGINWIKLYLPVFLAAAVVAILLVRSLRRDAPAGVPPLVGGALCWTAAQMLEWAEWLGTDVAQPGYWPMVLAEETLENIGSSLFVLALLIVVKLRRGAVVRSAEGAAPLGRVGVVTESD